MLTVGLTGGIAVGKSTVMATLGELGAVCFDADAIARSVVEPGTPALDRVIDAFGSEVCAPDGTLDRAALGRIVFADPARRRMLEAILHPPIIAEQDRLIAEAGRTDPDAIVVVDAALMIESGSFRRFDVLVVVHCSPEVQMERLMRRNGISADEARQRIDAQMPQAEKLALADIAIDTSGSRDDTRARTIAAWAELVKRRDARC